jgi:hypothetical protein
LWKSDAEHEVIGHPLIRTHHTLGDAVSQPPDGGVNIGLGERVGAFVEIDVIDPRQIGAKLGFKERQRPPSITPLIGLRARDIAPPAIDQRVECLKLCATGLGCCELG